MERKEIKLDWIIIILLAFFLIAGWLTIYAASNKDPEVSIFDLNFNFGKQFLYIVITIILGVIILTLDTKLIELGGYLFYGFCILLLILVLIIGQEFNGSRSWFLIGNFSLQPSEFAKLGTTLALAKYMSRFNFSFKNLSDRLALLGIIGLPMALIMLQKDAGTALTYAAFGLMFYREGLNSVYYVLFFILVVVTIMALVIVNKILVIGIITGATLLIYYFIFNQKYKLLHTAFAAFLILQVLSINFVVENVLKDHQKKRILALFNPDFDRMGVNWNTLQSKIAIGSGGFIGKGYLKGTQTKYEFVPEQATDFIFCTIGEEFGWVGSTILLGLYITFMFQIIHICENSRSSFARIYGYGIVSVFFFHIAVNIAMTIGLAPVIGIPLPFFSYGGSSMLTFSAMTFVMLNFYANRVNVFSPAR